MNRFSLRRFNLRARPWLVLWLLPYLVMSVAGAAHNHGFGDSHGCTPVAAAISGDAVSQHAHQSCADAVAATSQAAHELWCLACQFAGFAAQIVAPFGLVLAAASLFFAPFVLASRRRTLCRATSRGPPSPLFS